MADYVEESFSGADPEVDSKFGFGEHKLNEIVYEQLYALRLKQAQQGIELSDLGKAQWGLAHVHGGHHIFARTSPVPEVKTVYKVVVCDECAKNKDELTYLGTYGDKESALLVNDVHEILNGRCDHLNLLRREDAMFFHHLKARVLDESSQKLLPPMPVLSVLEKVRLEAVVNDSSSVEENKSLKKRTVPLSTKGSSSAHMVKTTNSAATTSASASASASVSHCSSNPASTNEESNGDDDDDDEEDFHDGDSSDELVNYAPFSDASMRSPDSKRAAGATSPGDDAFSHTSTESHSERAARSSRHPFHEGAFAGRPRFEIPDKDKELPRPSPAKLGPGANPLSSLFASASALAALEAHPFVAPRLAKERPVKSATKGLPPRSQSLRARPRAQTISVIGKRDSPDLTTEAERTPMGLVTWLASLEDDDFAAARMLAEMGSDQAAKLSPVKPAAKGSLSKGGKISRSNSSTKSMSALEGKNNGAVNGSSGKSRAQKRNDKKDLALDDLSEQPVSRRKMRANSVIEVNNILLLLIVMNRHN
jgi:hypothetical protein